MFERENSINPQRMELAKLKNIVPGQDDIVINSEKFSIGRGKGNTCVIASLEISRRQCEFTKVERDWLITDKSTNGILINGKAIRKDTPTRIEDKSTVIFGENYKYVFESGDRNVPGTVFSESELLEIADQILNDEDSNEFYVRDKSVPSEDNSQTAEKKEDTVLVPTTSTDQPSQSKSAEPPKKDGALTKVVDEAIEEELHCSICTELFIKAVTLNCSHTYCNYCINKWMLKNKCCPICRVHITNTAPTIVLDTFISRIVEASSEETKKLREKIVKERQEESSPSTSKAASSSVSNRRNIVSTLVEISDSDETFSDYDWDEDLDEYNSDDDYNGMPGAYYGGYGSCYSCGQTGHWSNGCPFRRRV